MNISHAQKWLLDNELDAYLHLHTDPHQSEYLAKTWQGMSWLTGFTGSAGSVVLTTTDAALWADSRYYLQGENQLDDSGASLMKMGLPETPTIEEWLLENIGKDSIVGIDPRLVSVKGFRRRQQALKKHGITLVPVTGLLEDIWTDRPEPARSTVMIHDVRYAGKSREEKLSHVREKMEEAEAQYLLVPSLDDIAWLLNLRGNDISYNPVFMSYLLVGRELGWLFIDEQQITAEVAMALKTAGIQLMPYEAIEHELAQLEPDDDIWIDPTRNNYFLAEKIPDGVLTIEKPLPTILMKACKNETEQAHTRSCHIRDGVAMVKFLHWLSTHIGEETITEISAAAQLEAFRQEQALYQGKSFGTISGYAQHGALPHYSVTAESDIELKPEGIFLIDSGGQYLDGTTDITRTVAMGSPTPTMKRDNTLVLKGHIALATASFPTGTQGVQLDVLARQFLWQAGMDFGHGTGHGVGFFLNVHEGPASIGYKVNPQPALQPGMFLSNEPGLYRAGQYGIRIENLMFVQKKEENEFGNFLHFESVTLCPFDLKLVDVSLLTDFEKQWLNDYHAEVRKKLEPLVEGEVRAWLMDATREV